MKNGIEIQTEVAVPLAIAWKFWTEPQHIANWNFASDDWCAPRAENNLTVNGSFSYRMESKDGKMGFDLKGTYSKIINEKTIEFALEDGRLVAIKFISKGYNTLITEIFEPEHENSIELQRNGWQAILNNYKKYTEYENG